MHIDPSDKKHTVIGVMSGSSMDGLDIASVNISLNNNSVALEYTNTECIRYPEHILQKLSSVHSMNTIDYLRFNAQYSRCIARMIEHFITTHQLHPLAIGIHGHTVLHDTHEHISEQMGNGGLIAEITGYPCVTDFRSQDMTAGGQGAPMAALIDHYVYRNMPFCLNLGGIANITIQDENILQSFDIGPFNQIFNIVSQKLGEPYDKNGEWARKGECISSLFALFNAFPFYQLPPPKSLDNKELQEYFFPIILQYDDSSPYDILNTFCQHITDIIARTITRFQPSNVIVTGGGAYNAYALELLQEKIQPFNIHIPDKKEIDYKECGLIALSTLWRILQRPNFIPHASGASHPVSGGALYICIHEK